MSPLLEGQSAAAEGDVDVCQRCGAPSAGEICAFCRLVEKSGTHVAVPVAMVLKTRRRRRH